jgi:uncharacterized protein with PIN domain
MVLLTERMLGRLARWLRLLGHDAPILERPPARVPPGAVLLTRRVCLAGRPGVIFVKHDRVEDQLAQVAAELGLTVDPARLLCRCLDCNLPVEPIGRSQAAGLVPDYTLATAPCFTRCPGCGKVFWPGSHGQRALARLEEMLGKNFATTTD